MAKIDVPMMNTEATTTTAPNKVNSTTMIGEGGEAVEPRTPLVIEDKEEKMEVQEVEESIFNGSKDCDDKSSEKTETTNGGPSEANTTGNINVNSKNSETDANRTTEQKSNSSNEEAAARSKKGHFFA